MRKQTQYVGPTSTHDQTVNGTVTPYRSVVTLDEDFGERREVIAGDENNGAFGIVSSVADSRGKYQVTTHGHARVDGLIVGSDYYIDFATARLTDTPGTVIAGRAKAPGVYEGNGIILQFYRLGGGSGPSNTAPVLAGGTSSVANVTPSGGDLSSTDTFTDGGDPITDTGWVTYAGGTNENDPSAVLHSDGDIDGTDFTDPLTVGGLTPGTNYCAKPYATNGIGTTYGSQICFTTAPIPTGYAYMATGVNIVIGTVGSANLPGTGLLEQANVSGRGGTNTGVYVHLTPTALSTIITQAGVYEITGGTLTLKEAITTAGGLVYDDTYAYRIISGNIQKIEPSTRSIVATAPIGTGSLVATGSELLLKNGNIWTRINKTTLASGLSYTFTGPNGSTDRMANVGGDLFIGELFTGTITRVSLATMTATGTISPAGFSNIRAIMSDGTYLYVNNNLARRKVDPTTGAILINLSVTSGLHHQELRGGYVGFVDGRFYKHPDANVTVASNSSIPNMFAIL